MLIEREDLSDLIIETRNKAKDFVNLTMLIETLHMDFGSQVDNLTLSLMLGYDKEEIKELSEYYSDVVPMFLLSNNFHELVSFYEINNLYQIKKIPDDTGKKLVRFHLISIYNEFHGTFQSRDNRNLISFLDGEWKELKALEEKLSLNDIYIHIDELKNLDFLKGKINPDELTFEFTKNKPNLPHETLEECKIKLVREQGENYRLSQENTKLKAQIASLTDNHSPPQTGEPITPADNDSEPTEPPTIDRRTENAYLLTIGILLDLLTTPKGIDNRPTFPSQSAIISEITDRQLWGQGKATLEKRFKQANDSLKQAKKIK